MAKRLQPHQMARLLATATKGETVKAWMPELLAELGAKCDRRTKALIKAVDALEEIRRLISLSYSKKHMDDKHLLLLRICIEALEQIELQVEENINQTEEHHGKNSDRV